MKINSQLTPLPTQLTSFSNQEETGFDQLLSTPNKHTKGGDYYLQHQGQLQQSALTFHPLNNKNPRPSTRLNPIDHDEITYEPIEVATIPVTQELKAQQIVIKQVLSETCTQPKKDINELVMFIKKTVESGENSLKAEIKNQPVSKNNIPELRTQNVLTESIFKNHQLFVSNNSVELTLNTTQLSKQQTNELKKLIRQWLADKGLVIKQWIINGEEQ